MILWFLTKQFVFEDLTDITAMWTTEDTNHTTGLPPIISRITGPHNTTTTRENTISTPSTITKDQAMIVWYWIAKAI